MFWYQDFDRFRKVIVHYAMSIDMQTGAKIFRDTFFTEHFQMTASEICIVSFLRIFFVSLDTSVLLHCRCLISKIASSTPTHSSIILRVPPIWCYKTPSDPSIKNPYQYHVAYSFRAYSRLILHLTIEHCLLLWKLCKALFWCKTLRKWIEQGEFGGSFFIKKCPFRPISNTALNF